MRGVWVASVANIDFPLKPTTDTAQLKKEWLTMLDGFAQHGLNAVYVQIRPAADALYATPLAPWSAYLSGKQGQALQGGWDPLPFLIEADIEEIDQVRMFEVKDMPHAAHFDVEVALNAFEGDFFPRIVEREIDFAKTAGADTASRAHASL